MSLPLTEAVKATSKGASPTSLEGTQLYTALRTLAQLYTVDDAEYGYRYTEENGRDEPQAAEAHRRRLAVRALAPGHERHAGEEARSPMGAAMKIYGYARVSSSDQSLDVQREALKAAGSDVILEEKVSGASREGRVKLALLPDVLGKGDTLVVTKLDRLARDTVDMLELVREIGAKGAGFKSLVRCNGAATRLSNNS
jgi:hypothetical protein